MNGKVLKAMNNESINLKVPIYKRVGARTVIVCINTIRNNFAFACSRGINGDDASIVVPDSSIFNMPYTIMPEVIILNPINTNQLEVKRISNGDKLWILTKLKVNVKMKLNKIGIVIDRNDLISREAVIKSLRM